MSEAQRTLKHLVCDIGGTNIRLAAFSISPLEAMAALKSDGLAHQQTYKWVQVPDLYSAIDQFCAAQGLAPVFETLTLAMAGLVLPEQQEFAFTNQDQTFTLARLQAYARQVRVINDFAAQAAIIPHLKAEGLKTLKPGLVRAGNRAVLGPGTGLGVAGLSAAGQVIPGEGGNVALPILPHSPLTQPHGGERLRIEDALSGHGLVRLYRALGGGDMTPSALSQVATAGDPMAREAFTWLFDYLAVSSANQALQYGAAGGIYVVGDVVGRNVGLLDPVRFTQTFCGTPTHAAFLADVPVYLVTAASSGLAGAAAYLATC